MTTTITTLAPAASRDPDVFLTLAQTAELMNISEQTFKNWRSSQRVPTPPALRLGGLLRWHKPDVIAWMLSQREVG